MEINIHGSIKMNTKKELTLEETFKLAYQKHKKNDFKEAENLYTKILKIGFHVIFHQTENAVRVLTLCFPSAVLVCRNWDLARCPGARVRGCRGALVPYPGAGLSP